MRKIVLGGLALMFVVSTAMATDIQIQGKKLIIVDKTNTVSKAKLVFVAKDANVNKGTGTDPAQISVEVSYQSPTLGASGSAEMPLGSSGWIVNKSTVSKYVNKSAPSGGAVKVGVIKPNKLLKAVLKDLGDTGSLINVFQGGATTNPIDMNVQYTIVNGGQTFRHCAQFTGCSRKLIAAGQGAKVVCKTPVASPSCPASPSGAFLN
jgi:hypothetical protein